MAAESLGHNADQAKNDLTPCKPTQMTLDRIRRVDYSIPNTVSKDAADLIRQLLQHCPSHRPSLDAVSKHPFLAVSSNPEHPSPSPFHGPGAALRGRISKGSPSGESALSHGHSSTSCAFADVPGPADGSLTHEPYKSWVSSQSQPHNSPDASHASAHSAEHVVPSSNTHQAPGHERCTQTKTTCHQHNSASSCRDTLPQSRGCNQHGFSSLTTSITSYNCGSGGPHDLLPKQETGRRGVPKLEVPRASEYQNDKSQQHVSSLSFPPSLIMPCFLLAPCKYRRRARARTKVPQAALP